MRRLGILLILIFLVACAGQQQLATQRPIVIPQGKKEIPAGLDAKTVQEADSVFNEANVTERSQQIAAEYFRQAEEMAGLCDSLWNFMTSERHSKSDTTKALQWRLRALEHLKVAPYESRSIWKLTKKYGRLHSSVIDAVVRALIPQTSKIYESAIRYNRFVRVFRQHFAAFLESSYEKIMDRTFLDRAIEQHETVVKSKKDSRISYAKLGNLYYKEGKWQKAFENYGKAATLLKKTAIFSVPQPELYFDRLPDVPVDTARLVSYLSYQANSKIHLYEAQPALKFLRIARKLTPIEKYKQSFKKQIKWILWDDGNIRASEMKDKADSILNANNYQEGKATLLALLGILSTKRTQDETNWKIAQIDFTYLDNEEAGIARMHRVIKYSAKDSLTGAPIDSLAGRYFDSYGLMCFQLGLEFLEQDLSYAYVYFSQIAQTPCADRAKAYIQLAVLSQFDPNEVINLCNKAMENKELLDNDSRKAMYEILYKAYRKLGNFTAARDWYDRWQGE
ncbi:MAG: hypothetical protein GXO74_01175 [Calditrichaeota bacterium]|nr:hypothetical protein [Calditrichota bacterium]